MVPPRNQLLVHVLALLVLQSGFLVDAFSVISSPVGSLSIGRHGGGPRHAHDDNDHTADIENEMDRRDAMMRLLSAVPVVGAASVVLGAMAARPQAASPRLEAVNRPDLLPKESGLSVIQTEKLLTTGQAKRMDQLLKALERDTGFRVRLLCQNYPNTPGLAIRDYWDLGKDGQKDDKYVVMVVDSFGERSNALNFNVGDGVKFALPNGP
jgi:TPM domain